MNGVIAAFCNSAFILFKNDLEDVPFSASLRPWVTACCVAALKARIQAPILEIT